MKVMIIPIVIDVFGTVIKRLIQRLEELGKTEMKTSADHPNYCITEICQNTGKSPGQLRIIAVS